MDETRKELLKAMGFSEKAISILDQELNMKTMPAPSVKLQHQGSCGDILMLSIKTDKRKIRDASFEYIGCAGLQVCASATTEMIKGQTLDEAKKLSVKDILDYLEGIPEQKYECAEICEETLKMAIEKVTKEN